MSRPVVAVLDYGSGNLHSATRSLAAAGAEVALTADPHVCRHLALERTGPALQVRRSPDHAKRHRQQLRPLRREGHSGGATFEQRHPELVLQRTDLGGHRRLAHVKPLGGPGEVAVFGDCGKSAQLIELHVVWGPFLSLSMVAATQHYKIIR